MNTDVAQDVRAAGLQLHDWGANITVMAKGSKKPNYRWACIYDTPQTPEDVQRLPWRNAVGVGVLNGINDWRTLDLDARKKDDHGKPLDVVEPVSRATVTAVVAALGLPADYRWVWHSGSDTGWEVAFRCSDDLPPGVLSAKDKEPGVFWGVPKDNADPAFDHIELRWHRCQTIYPPSQHEDPANPGYRWAGDTPDAPPAVVSVGHVLAAFFAVAKNKPAEVAPKVERVKPERIDNETSKNDDAAKLEIKQRFDLVKYALDKFGGEAKKERNGEIRITGHGGLVIEPDEDVFYTFQDEVGGDCFDLAGKHLYNGQWNRNDPKMFVAALKEAADYTGVTLPEPAKGTTITRNADGRIVVNTGAKPRGTSEPGTTPPARKLVHVSELHTLPKTEDIIPGVLSKNKLNLIFGLPGVGKSLINLDMALTVSQYATVVYLAGEDAEEYLPRVQAWSEQHGAEAGHLYFWPEPVNLLSTDSVDAFLAEVAELNPALIVVDTLQNCMVGADENSTKEMGVAIDALHYIRRQTQAGLLVCHHTGWADTHERGSSALRGAVRIAMKVTQSDDGLISVTCEKSNNAAAFEPRYFRLIPKAESVTVVPSSKLTGRDAPLTQKHYDILEALTLKTLADGASFSQIFEHTSIAKGTLNRAISKLLERGYVESTEGRNKVYSLTSTGRHELQTQMFQAAGPNSTRVPGEFQEKVEQAWNWTVTLPETLDASSSVVPPSSSVVPPSSTIVPPSEPDSSEFRSSSPPYKGGTWNSEPVEPERIEPEKLVSDYDHDKRREREVDEALAVGKPYKEVRRIASFIRGNRDRLRVDAKIDDHEAARGAT